jgi:hypothetical protein
MAVVDEAPPAADGSVAAASTQPRARQKAAAVVIPFVLTLTTLVALALRLPPTSAVTASASPASGSPSPAPSRSRSGSGDPNLDLMLPPTLSIQEKQFGTLMFTDDSGCRSYCSGGLTVTATTDVPTVLAIYAEHLSARSLRRWLSESPGDELWLDRDGKQYTRVRVHVTPRGTSATVVIDLLRSRAPRRAELEDALLLLELWDSDFVSPGDDHPVPGGSGEGATLTYRTARSVEAALDAVIDAAGFDFTMLGAPCRSDGVGTAFWLSNQVEILLSAEVTRSGNTTIVKLTATARPDSPPAFC